MSDISTTDFGSVDTGADVAVTEPVADATTDAVVEDGAPEGLTDATPEPEYLFEVDGTKVSLEDARNGYLRQSDYTKKTQELAEQRKQLAQAEAIVAALEKDPASTLAALQEHFGVSTPGQPDPLADLDPEQRAIVELQQWKAEQEQAAVQERITKEFDQLREAFGEVDETEVLKHAIKGNFPSITAAYKDLTYDQIRSATEKRQAEEQQRTDAKRDASFVEGGASKTGAAPAPVEQPESFADSFKLAMKQLGLSSVPRN